MTPVALFVAKTKRIVRGGMDGKEVVDRERR